METFTSGNAKITVVRVPTSTYKVSFLNPGLHDVTDIILNRDDLKELIKRIEDAKARLADMDPNTSAHIDTLIYPDNKRIMVMSDNRGGNSISVTGIAETGDKSSLQVKGVKVSDLVNFLGRM